MEQKAAAGEPIPAGELARLRAVIERQEADAELAAVRRLTTG